MELTDQWRREWTGTAEYGKVTVGGVTRRVARAMEVLHASAPGARVRVMRAAYHSSAGPGSSSYLMQSSRQVLSSGYNFVDNSSLPSKPLEISSTPLESSPESEAEKEDYKVTEPDDYDISEPSKWRGSSRKDSIRMPSEESSSADNASIIDLDTKISSRSTSRRSLQSKENGDLHRNRNINTRSSPLLDAPVALSTLKYASILNNTDEWNRRRKSYSFEETSLDSISAGKNFFNMDSSTDSGICKSSEVVSDYRQNKGPYDFEKTDNIQEETFKEWLSKNRSNSYTRTMPPKPRDVHVIDTHEDKITLQPSGKITITLPVETYTNKKHEISKFIDENDRKTKKVEFCKTELHFAVDTGTVNIIATDEKPPPSNDFRRKRSAFIPLNDKIDRPITLFGEKYDTAEIKKVNDTLHNDFSDFDENTAATKSILKNKIPKPKPYLLGENMAIGHPDNDINDLIKNSSSSNKCTTSAVSMINRHLLTERRSSNETVSSCASDLSPFLFNPRTENKGPLSRNDIDQRLTSDSYDHIKNISRNKKVPLTSPTPNRAKLRELRGSDLAYFGIKNNAKPNHIHSQDNLQDEIFHSVKLVQQISNSVCNSEAESDDTPEYQNIIPKHNYQVAPTPKPRSKYGDELKPLRESKVLKPIIEHDVEKVNSMNQSCTISKRNKEPLKPLRRNSVVLSKSLSGKENSIDKKYTDFNDVSSSGKNKHSPSKRAQNNKENETKMSNGLKPEPSSYVNVKLNTDKSSPSSQSLRHEKTKRPLRNELKEKTTKNIHKGQSLEKYGKFVNERPEDSQHINKNVPRAENLKISDSKDESTTKRYSRKNMSPTKVSIRSSLEKNKNETKAKDITKLKKREDSITKSSKNTSTITKESNKLTQLDDGENILLQSSNKGLVLSKDIKTNNVNIEKIPGTKSDKSLKSKRSKYVINYDDKNGTVSSICKIKSGPGMYKRKLISVENNDAQKYNTNDKKLNKIALRK